VTALTPAQHLAAAETYATAAAAIVAAPDLTPTAPQIARAAVVASLANAHAIMASGYAHLTLLTADGGEAQEPAEDGARG
jgi:hypothetical protein